MHKEKYDQKNSKNLKKMLAKIILSLTISEIAFSL